MSEVLGDPHEAAVQSRTYFVAVLINSLSYGEYCLLLEVELTQAYVSWC
jgi:hypothetical protein